MRSLQDNVASSVKDGHPIARNGGDCQHQGGQELGSNGKVNTSESLINVVITNKPKVLRVSTETTGLNQNGAGSGVGAAE